MPTPTDLIKTITVLANDVYKRLGSGFDEKVYENAMAVGLRLAKIPYQAQKVVELTYKEHYVGEGYPDLIVGAVRHRLILELKATSKLGDKEEQQLRNYLRILGLNKGLLINFQAPGQNTKGKTRLEIRRVTR
ncbi:MAG: GxxExxY protein [Candidatus Andersenbacteria bacterium]